MGIGYGKKGQNAGVMRIPETKKPPLGGLRHYYLLL